MAFPTNRGVTPVNLSGAWDRARNIATTVKLRTVQMSSGAAVGGVSSLEVLDYATFLADQRLALLDLAAIPGMAAYAQAQVNNPARDISAEFNAMVNAMQSTVDWIVTNFPKDVNGFLLSVTFLPGGSGRTTPRLFSAADLTTFKTVVDALSLTME